MFLREIYFDNAATTRVCSAAADGALRMMREVYGNPSSLHGMGIDAEHAVDEARKTLALCAGCSPDEILFTSGGTESNNLALFGAAGARQRQGRHIVASMCEHASVLGPLRELEKQGFEVSYVRPDAAGRMTAEGFEACLREDTVLVSCMLVNNEVGTLGPIPELRAMLRRHGCEALLHCDAVQGFMKLPGPAVAPGADLVSLSGHKLHAPKGVGALIVRRGVRILPRMFGGGQERALRPGTECTPLIAAFGAAAAEARDSREIYLKQLPRLKQYLLEGLRELSDVRIVSEGDVPYILSAALCGRRSETVLHFLAERGIYLSSGSACARGKQSHVLSAMGCDRQLADSALRISLSRYSTKEEADALIEGLAEASAKLKGRT